MSEGIAIFIHFLFFIKQKFWYNISWLCRAACVYGYEPVVQGMQNPEYLRL